MKKILWIGLIVSLFASLVSCATFSKKAITAGDLSIMKGRWEGERQVREVTGKYAVVMEIYNDTAPFKGKLTLYDVVLAGIRGSTEEINFQDGKIDSAGRFVIAMPNTELELTLYQSNDKTKLEGNYIYKTVKGTLVLYKK
jgi:hypothetical protein